MKTPNGLRWYWQIAAVCAAVALVFSRQPSAFLSPQFFAEDGHVWFANAYNNGWLASLFRTQDGYYQTLPRLAASVALLVPLARAPLVMNLVGLLVQVLPVPLLLSSRFSGWGSLQLRAILALAYIALPNCSETNVTVEEAQWHLALTACLLLLASRPRNVAWKVLDAAVLVLCGLTGPFAILLTPIAALTLWLRREGSSVWQLGILIVTATIQANALLLTDHAARNRWPLGASFEGFIRIIAGRAYLGAIFGSGGLATRPITFLACVAIGGSLLVAYCAYKASIEWKLFLLFAGIVFAVSLYSPFTPSARPGSTSWNVLIHLPGLRYWFFPTLASMWTIVWYLLAETARPQTRIIGATLALAALIGIVRDWRISPWPDLHFAAFAQKFDASPPGAVVTIPLYPEGWSLRLVKR